MNKDIFSVTWELVPGRGARERAQDDLIRAAEQAAGDGRIHAVTVTDNAGGNPAMSATYLGLEILQLGLEPLVHFACKDKNRNQIEAELYAMDRAGLRNILLLTGDYQVKGFAGRPKPVFDLDSVQALDMVSAMNRGFEIPGSQGAIRNQPADFFAGAVVSPFKATEAELLTQYYKLKKKIAHGAAFIVTQLGYDARKFHEVLQLVRSIDPGVAVIGNVYVLPFGVGRMMNANQLPGCVVPDRLLAELDKERAAEDKGKSARLLRAAKMYALLKGMGFDGVHLGGHNVKYDDVKFIIEQGEALSANWTELIAEFDFPQPGGFYFFEPDPATGLNSAQPTDRAALPAELPAGFNYRLMRLFHHLFFTPEQSLYPFMQRRYAGKKDPRRYRLEHRLKVLGNDCRDCGNCALMDMAYLCPMSQCPKNQRNGPCGGSHNGWCEVYPNEKRCVWVQAYSRLKTHNAEAQLEATYLPPVNWDLEHTSAWYNYYTGRDHSGNRK